MNLSNNINLLIILFFSSVILYSCEDVIELDLKDSEPKIVIEAVLDAGAQELEVIISKSNSFYEAGDLAKVSDAKIVLEDEQGTTYEAMASGDGRYLATGIEAVPGEAFTIEVESNERIYTARAICPTEVYLDSIGVTETERNRPDFGVDSLPAEKFNILTAFWKDKGVIENYYRIKTYRNDSLEAQVYSLEKDGFNDGSAMSLTIRNPYQAGTNVKLELLSVNEEYYTYFTQLSAILGEGFNSTTPFNPESNFNNEALGYFGIIHTSTMSVEL